MGNPCSISLPCYTHNQRPSNNSWPILTQRNPTHLGSSKSAPKPVAIPNLNLDSQEFQYLISSWSSWSLLIGMAHPCRSSEIPCPAALRVCGAPSKYPTATLPLVFHQQHPRKCLESGKHRVPADAMLGGMLLMSFSRLKESAEGKAYAKEIAACCNTPPVWRHDLGLSISGSRVVDRCVPILILGKM